MGVIHTIGICDNGDFDERGVHSGWRAARSFKPHRVIRISDHHQECAAGR